MARRMKRIVDTADSIVESGKPRRDGDRRGSENLVPATRGTHRFGLRRRDVDREKGRGEIITDGETEPRTGKLKIDELPSSRKTRQWPADYISWSSEHNDKENGEKNPVSTPCILRICRHDDAHIKGMRGLAANSRPPEPRQAKRVALPHIASLPQNISSERETLYIQQAKRNYTHF